MKPKRAKGTDLTTELWRWIARRRKTEWSGPESMTAEDGYNAALEELEALLDAARGVAVEDQL